MFSFLWAKICIWGGRRALESSFFCPACCFDVICMFSVMWWIPGSGVRCACFFFCVFCWRFESSWGHPVSAEVYVVEFYLGSGSALPQLTDVHGYCRACIIVPEYECCVWRADIMRPSCRASGGVASLGAAFVCRSRSIDSPPCKPRRKLR